MRSSANLDPARDRELIADFFEPYAAALADQVDARLAATGRAMILDVHSYPRDPLPYELHQSDARPEICLGVDETHTPGWLVDAARSALEALGEVKVNQPFRGTYVPLRHYGTDVRVSSLMLEIRRDVYGAGEGAAEASRVRELGDAIASVVEAIDAAR